MLEAPLGLSHPQTSFIGTVCQASTIRPRKRHNSKTNCHCPTAGFLIARSPDDKS